MSQVVFFDLDGTICRVNSGYALVRTAYSKKHVNAGGIVKALLYSFVYKLGLARAETIINIMGGWIRGMKHETLSIIAKEAAEEFLFNSFYNEALAEIKLLKSENADLVILSSAIDDICRPLAAHLGIENILCTEMETSDGTMTGSPLKSYCFGEEKKRRILAFCSEKGFDTASAWYYADSYSDLAALQTIGNPVCINPDRKLRKKALEKGWQIRIWKTVR